MLSFDVADAAIRLRLLALGDGSFACGTGEEFVRTMRARLPGTGSTVVIVTDDTSRSYGRLLRPDGKPMSVLMNLDEPDMLASLLHNVDCEAFAHGVPDGFAVEDLAAIDAAVVSGDPAIRSEIAAALAITEFSGEAGAVGTSPRYRRLVDAMADSGNGTLEEASEAARYADRGGREEFDERVSLIRWSALVEAMHAREASDPDAIVPTDDGTWRRVFTLAGVTAVARRMDRIEGEFSGWPELLSERRPVVERLQKLLARDFRERSPDSGIRHYILERHGVAEVVAMVRGNDVHAERGDREELTQGDLDTLMELKARVAPGWGNFGLSLR